MCSGCHLGRKETIERFSPPLSTDRTPDKLPKLPQALHVARHDLHFIFGSWARWEEFSARTR